MTKKEILFSFIRENFKDFSGARAIEAADLIDRLRAETAGK